MTDLEIEIDLPDLYPMQYQAIFCDARYGVIEASTKAGKTVGCLVWQIAQCLQRPGHHWWVAPVFSQARIAFDRAQRMLPRDIFTANESRLEMRISHIGSKWSFKSADKPDSLYGEDVRSAVIDEASRVKEASWIAVRSTLTATQGPIRIIGNVKGRGNWFYHIARRAQQKEPGYHYSKLTAYDAVEGGVLPIEEVEDAKRALPDHVFRELYLAEPADDGGNPFGHSAIEGCVRPISSKKPFVWGWDLAKSHDWTVGIALDHDGRVCRYMRFQRSWHDTIQTIISSVKNEPTLIDSTGVGDPIVEAVQRESRHVEGFHFSSASKQRLMEGLAVAIHSGSINYPDNEIRQELDLFEYEYRGGRTIYSAPSGLHDDCVMALGLAWHLYDRTPKTPASIITGSGGRRVKISF